MRTLILNRKEQIHEVAENLFKEKGYSATSMRHLAHAVGIEAASIYSHIKSKEEILKSICFRMAAEFFEAIEIVRLQQANPEEELKLAITAHINVVLSNLNAAAVFFHDWKHLSEPDLSEFRKMRSDYENYFRQIVARGHKNGEFAQIDEKLFVMGLLSALNQVYEWYKPEGGLAAEEVAKNFANIFLNGIRNPN